MRVRLAAVLLFSSLTAVGATGARAAGVGRPLVHPIYAHLPDLPEDEVTRRAFAAAALHYKLAPLEVIDVPAPPPPKARATLQGTIAKVMKLAFAEAMPELDAAAAEVVSTGGAGLTTAELADLFFFRAMATARADWNAPAKAAAGAANPDRARAFDDYLRAAALTPDRPLNAQQLPPQVIADFHRAVEQVRKGGRGTLVVRGDADAQVILDGGAPLKVAGGVTFRDVAYGDHAVAVEELGRAPWGTQVTLTGSTFELAIPERAALSLDNAIAADHARRMGTRFALVAERKPGPGAHLELRLIDLTGAKVDGALISTTGDERGTVDASVMRLDEAARRLVQLEPASGAPTTVPVAEAPPGTPAPILLAAPRGKATFHDDPLAWARDRWPLFTALGVLVGSAVVLSIAAN
jgi:hypothetical protein